jgi:hypothetical protein
MDHSSTRMEFNADKQGDGKFVRFMPHLTTSHLRRLVRNKQKMFMNNELGITCHCLSEDAIELCKGTEENNKPQQDSWSVAYGLDTQTSRQTDRQTDTEGKRHWSLL